MKSKYDIYRRMNKSFSEKFTRYFKAPSSESKLDAKKGGIFQKSREIKYIKNTL